MTSSNTLYKTGFRRLVAAIIDTLVLTVVTLPAIYPLFWPAPLIVYAVIALVCNLVSVFYYVLAHYYYGQTVGKYLMGVIVVKLDGTDISMKQALLRDIVPVLLLPYMFVSGISYYQNYLSAPNSAEMSFLEWIFTANLTFSTFDYVLQQLQSAWYWLEILTMMFNQKRRAVHDFIASTVVVRVE